MWLGQTECLLHFCGQSCSLQVSLQGHMIAHASHQGHSSGLAHCQTHSRHTKGLMCQAEGTKAHAQIAEGQVQDSSCPCRLDGHTAPCRTAAGHSAAPPRPDCAPSGAGGCRRPACCCRQGHPAPAETCSMPAENRLRAWQRRSKAHWQNLQAPLQVCAVCSEGLQILTACVPTGGPMHNLLLLVPDCVHSQACAARTGACQAAMLPE